MPIPGQFFNTGPPLAARPLIPGTGFRLPPQLQPPLGAGIPRPRLPPQNQNKFRLAAPPKTTVFVGNISEEVDTTLLQRICEVGYFLEKSSLLIEVLGVRTCQ